MMNVVVLHDSFEGYGGAENVAVEIAKIFNAPIYTATKNSDCHEEIEIISLTEPSKNYAVNFMRSVRAFRKLKLDCDVVISSGNETRFYKPTKRQKHINYTHTPSRMFYDLRGVFKQKMNFPKSLAFELFCFFGRRMVEKSLNNINRLLCNSEVVRERIRKYWGVDAEVVYPPVDTSKFKYRESEGYFLYISRLNTIKRIDVVIKAFKGFGEKLVVVGKDEEGFEDLLNKEQNIDYRGEVSENEKVELLSHCEAVIYPPKEEDFGLVPIEAFASGKPVIGVKEGFTKYQINDKKGVFVNPTPEGIQEGVKKVKEREWEPKEIRRYAEQFDIKVFERRLKEMVGNYE